MTSLEENVTWLVELSELVTATTLNTWQQMAVTNASITDVDSRKEEVDSRPPTLDAFQTRVHRMRLYATTVSLGISVLSNLLATALLAQRNMRCTPPVVYLLAMSTSSVIYLLVRVNDFIASMGYSLYGVINAWCHLITFLRGSSDSLCIWSIVMLSMERYIHMCRPEYKMHLNTVWKARILVISLSIIVTVIYLNTCLLRAVAPMPHLSVYMCITLVSLAQTERKLHHAGTFINSVFALALLIAFFGLTLCYKCHNCKESAEFWLETSCKRKTKRSLARRSLNADNSVIQEEEELRAPAEQPGNSNLNKDTCPSNFDITCGQTRVAVAFIITYLVCHTPLHCFEIILTAKSIAEPNRPPDRVDFMISEILYFIKYLQMSLSLPLLIIFYEGFRNKLSVQLVNLFRRIANIMRITRVENTNIEMEADQLQVRTRVESHSKSSWEDSSTMEFVSHESAYV